MQIAASSGVCRMSTSNDELARGDQCQLPTLVDQEDHKWRVTSKVER